MSLPPTRRLLREARALLGNVPVRCLGALYPFSARAGRGSGGLTACWGGSSPW
jgi:hypothetical protein